MASEVSPHLDIDFEYLKLRRDLRNPWALGALHESYTGFWTRLPDSERGRSPFTADQSKSFEKVHASVGARIQGGGLGADDKAYASKALKDGDLKANTADLSPIEKSLMWSTQDVKPQAPGAEKAKSLLDEFVKLFGVTS
jgi:hypothetical protein